MNNFDLTAHGSRIRTVTLAGLLCAAAVLLSGMAIPVGPTRCFPFQHTVNVLAGVLLGPWWAAATAFTASLIRNLLGTGTPFAFPGSVPGALAVGFAWKIFRHDGAALAEPLGTGLVGAFLAVFLVAPALGKSVGLALFVSAFLASSVPGAVIGLLVLTTLRRLGLRERSLQRQPR